MYNSSASFFVFAILIFLLRLPVTGSTPTLISTLYEPFFSFLIGMTVNSYPNASTLLSDMIAEAELAEKHEKMLNVFIADVADMVV